MNSPYVPSGHPHRSPGRERLSPAPGNPTGGSGVNPRGLPWRALSVLFAISSGGCLGQAPAPTPGPAPQGELISAWTATEGDLPGTGLYLRNNTCRDILVMALTLRGCVGLRDECRRYEVSVSLAPGETRRLMSVHRADPMRAFSFLWDFDWEYVIPQGGSDHGSEHGSEHGSDLGREGGGNDAD